MAAAVYPNPHFSLDYNAIGIKPVDVLARTGVRALPKTALTGVIALPTVPYRRPLA